MHYNNTLLQVKCNFAFCLISENSIYWCIMDGADCNRQFIKLHFHDKDPAEDKFVTYNIYTGTPMVFMMDPKVQLFSS